MFYVKLFIVSKAVTI